MSSGFWAGGASAYHDGLSKEYYANLKSLKARLKLSKDEAERQKITSEIDAARSEFKKKVANIGNLNF